MKFVILLFAILSVSPGEAKTPFEEGEMVDRGGILKGAFLYRENTEIVVIIPGSGPTDRDGNNSYGITSGIYKRLAYGLSKHDVSSLRIDKRGMFSSASPSIDPNNVTMEDYANDMLSWVQTLQEKTGNKCVWLAGHSEGGLVALLSAQKPDGICGIILLSTPSISTDKIIMQQLRANPANKPLLPAASRIMDSLLKGNIVPLEEIPNALYPIFHPVVQNFLISNFKLNPLELAKNVSLPILVIFGDKDVQVPPENAQELGLNGKNKLISLPEAGHMFIKQGKSELNYLDEVIPKHIDTFITEAKQSNEAF